MDRRATTLGTLALAIAAAFVGGLTLKAPIASDPQGWLPALVILAFICLAELARDRVVSVAYGAVIAGLTAGMIEIATHARQARATADLPEWQWWSIGITVLGLAAALMAALYAAGPARRPPRWLPWIVGLLLTSVGASGIWAVARADVILAAQGEGLGDLGLVTRSTLLAVVIGIVCGLIGDLRPAVERANRRAALGDGGRAVASTGRSSVIRLRGWLQILGEEIQPGRGLARQAVIDERARLARDLHADVAPALHAALRAVEEGRPTDHVADALRAAAAELDGVIGREHNVLLEVGGIVPAIEWLVERVEDHSAVRVDIDVDDGPEAAPAGRPPAAVEAAAFRVARLALDNVVRHAGASRVEVCVAAAAAAVRLDIRDHGPGIEPGAASTAARSGRRGLIDMRLEADSCGAQVQVVPAEGRDGTLVRFRWSSPG